MLLKKELKDDNLTREEYLTAVYIDFEGEGQSIDDELKMPHMIGEFTPSLDRAKYSAVFFKKEWKPLANGFGASHNASVRLFEEYVFDLKSRAYQDGRKIVSWSSHERKILKYFLNDELFKEIDCVLHNLLPPAKRYCARKRLRLEGDKRPKKLEEYYSLIFPNSAPQPELQIGAAESCRRIDRYCVRNARWRHFSDEQKRTSEKLLDYNKGDCRSAYKIARKVSNSRAVSQD